MYIQGYARESWLEVSGKGDDMSHDVEGTHRRDSEERAPEVIRICPLSMRPCFESYKDEWFADVFSRLGIPEHEIEHTFLECGGTDDYGNCPIQAVGEAMTWLRECITSTHDTVMHDSWLRVGDR